MSKRRIFRYFLLPVLAGLAATSLVYAYLGPAAGGRAKEEMTGVVVAVQAIPAKVQLTREMVVERQIPRQYVARGTMENIDQVVGKITLVPLAEGETILETKLALENSRTGLTYHVPEGMRAMSLKADPVAAVAGLVEPGDRVDVVAVFPATADTSEWAAHIYENLLVLAVDSNTQAGAPVERTKDAPLNSVTLAVTPVQSAWLALAEKNGHLEFILRSVLPGDNFGSFNIFLDDLQGAGIKRTYAPGK